MENRFLAPVKERKYYDYVGAPDRSRICNLPLTRRTRYQLRHGSIHKTEILYTELNRLISLEEKLFTLNYYKYSLLNRLLWSRGGDSNSWPHGYQPCALTNWATPRYIWWSRTLSYRYHYSVLTTFTYKFEYLRQHSSLKSATLNVNWHPALSSGSKSRTQV